MIGETGQIDRQLTTILHCGA